VRLASFRCLAIHTFWGIPADMLLSSQTSCLFLFIFRAFALQYDAAWTEYNLNQNESAVNALDYWGEWE